MFATLHGAWLLPPRESLCYMLLRPLYSPAVLLNETSLLLVI